MGFRPKHSISIPLEDRTAGEFLVYAIEALNRMKCTVEPIASAGVTARTVNNGRFAWNAKIDIAIIDGSAHITSTSAEAEMNDRGRNEKNITSFLEALNTATATLPADEFAARHEKLQPLLEHAEKRARVQPLPAVRITNFAAVFKPTREYLVTPILLYINITVFVAMMFAGIGFGVPDAESLLQWGAASQPLVQAGEWWRLLTYGFVHVRIVPFLFTTYMLAHVGFLLEPHIGKVRFLAAYLLTGIASGATSLWWHPFAVKAGAAGAVFGMFGVFLALLSTRLIDNNSRGELLVRILIFTVVSLFFGLQGLGIGGYIGGLIAGVIVGAIYIPGLKKQTLAVKYSTIGLAAVPVVTAAFLICSNLSSDIAIYQTRMKEFVASEGTAVRVLDLPSDTPKEQLLASLTEGIESWSDNIRILDEVDRLKIPGELRAHHPKLRNYCRLRLESYKLRHKAASEDSWRYKLEIEYYDRQIKALRKEMQKHLN